MAKKHLKRINAPNTWPIERKKTKWITRPFPGAHSLEMGMSINTVLKEILGVAGTLREVRYMLFNNEVLVNGKKIKDQHYTIGLFDTLSLDKSKQFRVLINTKGKLELIKIDSGELLIKPFKILEKTTLMKGKVQLNLSNGKNLLLEKNDYKVNDTLLLEFPKGIIKEIFKLEKGATIFMCGGKHIGSTGKIAEIKGNKVLFEDEHKVIHETLKKNLFVIGKTKPAITLKNESKQENKN